jgi:hypothetical protein
VNIYIYSPALFCTVYNVCIKLLLFLVDFAVLMLIVKLVVARLVAFTFYIALLSLPYC